MKLEKGIISSSQLVLLTAGVIQGSIFASGFADAITKQDTWLAILAAFVIVLPITSVYLVLVQQFPGKNLIQINDIIYGPYLGKLIFALYIWYFFLVTNGNLRFVGEFMLTYIMPETPKLAILIMFTFVCAWAVRNGIEVIARTSFTLVVITVIVVILTFVLLLKDMKLTNFLPFFEVPLKKFIQGTHIMVAFPFAEILVLLMVIPYVNKIKQAKRAVFLGLIIGGLTLLTVVVQDTAVLGPIFSITPFPSIEAVRLIDIADILTRLEVLYAIVLLIMMFLKVSLFYYATVLGLAQLFGLRSYLPLVLPIGIICISTCILMFDSPVEDLGAYTWPTWAFLFQVLLPFTSLILAKIRRLTKKQGG